MIYFQILQNISIECCTLYSIHSILMCFDTNINYRQYDAFPKRRMKFFDLPYLTFPRTLRDLSQEQSSNEVINSQAEWIMSSCV